MKTDLAQRVQSFDPRDPDPWVALYLDRTIPIAETAKRAWLTDSSSASRQFLLPLVRPVARTFVVLIQLLKILLPNRLTSSWLLHRLLYVGLKTFVSPEANLLIMRHFHIGSEVLDFIARNVAGVRVELNPLKPDSLNAIKNDLFLQHDLNLYNFIIRLNQQLREKDLEITSPVKLDFEGISEGDFVMNPMPRKWTNVLDIETAIELFTPVYQLFLTDNDFWRACNSLQLDETIGVYIAKILNTPEHLMLVNNKHPLVPESTLRAGYRLVLHGLSSEVLHELLVKCKQEAKRAA